MASPRRLGFEEVDIDIPIANYSTLNDVTRKTWVDAIFEMTQICYFLDTWVIEELNAFVQRYLPDYRRSGDTGSLWFNILIYLI